MMLLNCTRCDDLVVLVAEKVRSCMCGQCTGRLAVVQANPPVVTGPARVAELPWEEYDMASSGNWQKWRILRPKTRG